MSDWTSRRTRGSLAIVVLSLGMQAGDAVACDATGPALRD